MELRPGQIFALEYTRPVYPDNSREFPLFWQYFDDCQANARSLLIPNGCHTRHIGPDGLLTVVVNEDRYQEYLARKAEIKAAEEAETAAMYEDSVLEGGGDQGNNE